MKSYIILHWTDDRYRDKLYSRYLYRKTQPYHYISISFQSINCIFLLSTNLLSFLKTLHLFKNNITFCKNIISCHFTSGFHNLNTLLLIQNQHSFPFLSLEYSLYFAYIIVSRSLYVKSIFFAYSLPYFFWPIAINKKVLGSVILSSV